MADARKIHGSRSKQRIFSPNRRRASCSSDSAVSYTTESSIEKPSKERFERREARRDRGSKSRDGLNGPRKRRRNTSSSSGSYSSDYSIGRQRRNRSRDGERDGDRNTRRRRSSVSPDTRGRDRSPPRKGGKRLTISRSDSMDKGRIARARQSLTPRSPPSRERAYGREQVSDNPADSVRHRGGRANDANTPFRGPNGREGTTSKPPQQPPPRKERSLSPFSKRLALTQAMNMGHH